LLIGVPVVILGAMLLRSKAPVADVSGDSEDTGKPVFLAKSTPGNWLAVDPVTGKAYNTDGTITYVPEDTVTNGGADPAPGPATPPNPPVPPVTRELSAHEKHVLHLQHLQHIANTKGSGTVATGTKTSLAGSNTNKPLPKPSTVTVKRGDNLSSIARRNNTTVAKLVALNKIKNPNVIYAGSTLRIR